MKRVGIGVINYNRSELLEKLLDSLTVSGAGDCDIIVADDGSTDNSHSICDKMRIRRVGSKNMGIAWNKNRALYYLMNHTSCDLIMLIENDCLITSPDWLKTWSHAIERWGHINCLHPSTIRKIRMSEPCEEIYGGTGTSESPFLCTKISGICIGSTRNAVNEVGYFDTRFKGYGHEHAEWTLRFRRIGLGFKNIDLASGSLKCNIMISGGIDGLDVSSSSDKNNVEVNRKVMDECKADVTYRNPWRSDAERSLLLHEVAVAMAARL